MFRHREAGFDLISFWSFLLVVSPPHTLIMKYSKDKIVDQIIKKIIKRDLQGQKKYPKTMCKNNKSVILWIDDAIEEALDMVMYLQKIKKTITKTDIDKKDKTNV